DRRAAPRVAALRTGLVPRRVRCRRHPADAVAARGAARPSGPLEGPPRSAHRGARCDRAGAPAMTAPVLQVTGLTKSYGAIRAVDGVSFDVMPGEIFGVIGPNGSGKTTMFNSVLGQIKPDSGTIALHGHDVTRLSPLELNRRGVGRTFQSL